MFMNLFGEIVVDEKTSAEMKEQLESTRCAEGKKYWTSEPMSTHISSDVLMNNVGFMKEL